MEAIYHPAKELSALVRYPDINETELDFWRRKAQERADTIAYQEGRNTKLWVALDEISKILEEVFG